MTISFDIVSLKAHVVAPYRILYAFANYVELIISKSITCTRVDAIVVVLVLGNINVQANTSIWCRRFLSQSGRGIVGIGRAITKFNDREVFVAQIDTQGSLELSIVA